MPLKLNYKKSILWIAILLALTNGCDDRVTQVAREAADRQAQQNTAMANLNKEVAAGTHQLVAADAEARKEIVGVHHDLQAERTRMDSDWRQLEEDRRLIAGHRRTESMLASVVSLAGGILLTAMLLGFCWFLVVAAARNDLGAELAELVIQECLSDEHGSVITRLPLIESRNESENSQVGLTPPHSSGETA